MGVLGALAYVALGVAVWAVVAAIRRGNAEKQRQRIEELAESTRQAKP